jgi:hypothetical protein
MRPGYTYKEKVEDNHKTTFLKKKVMLNVKIIKEIEKKGS